MVAQGVVLLQIRPLQTTAGAQPGAIQGGIDAVWTQRGIQFSHWAGCLIMATRGCRCKPF